MKLIKKYRINGVKLGLTIALALSLGACASDQGYRREPASQETELEACRRTAPNPDVCDPVYPTRHVGKGF